MQNIDAQFNDFTVSRYEKNDDFFVNLFSNKDNMNYIMSLMIPEVYKKQRAM